MEITISYLFAITKKEDWMKIANDFNEIWNFPNCVGAIDGKHISIICPPGAGSEYYNYKGYHSIVLQAVVDAHAKFVVIDIDDYGRCSGIFKESLFAYPLLPNLMRPFPRRQLTNEKRIYNYRLSRARRIVECAFGIMVKRFNVLENKMLVGPEKATKITHSSYRTTQQVYGFFQFRKCFSSLARQIFSLKI
ncbi:uncharacterized protein LOC103308465 [Acyrthosiphon pisum]|uniref:DDE Tnp4 domain-containing protein n=1 Tax=Acyrthosiphon pisum TaxID=7029 RepID=A0A8R2AZU2_ACYPI|nr:uncharacterized protein LOC103308465 [Acyrthosiphon pisum]|eukprot:XP_008180084.1 PREDICTED: uncharacterized protein LOC103308465 [Acyrthosiphon pisum]